MSLPRQLEIDIATAVMRIEQAGREPENADWLIDRLVTCDAPRLRRYLSDEILSSMGQISERRPVR